MIIGHKGYNIALAANTGINNNHVDTALGKGVVAGPDGNGACQDIMGLDSMGQVDNPGLEVAAQDSPLDLPDKRVLKAKIGSQGNQINCIQTILLCYLLIRRNLLLRLHRDGDVHGKDLVKEVE